MPVYNCGEYLTIEVESILNVIITSVCCDADDISMQVLSESSFFKLDSRPNMAAIVAFHQGSLG